MVKLIQENNESFWVLNYLDHEMLNNITKVHEKYSEEELPSDWFVKCMKKAKELLDQGTRPDSVDAQKLAGDMWSMVKKYSNSQPEMIEKLYEFYTNTEHWPEKYSLMQKESQAFLEKSIEYYIGSLMVKENLKERS